MDYKRDRFDLQNEPNRLEKGVRFGCGGLLGLCLGIYYAFHYHQGSLGGILSIILALILLCGILAARYGDQFWEKFLKNRLWP